MAAAKRLAWIVAVSTGVGVWIMAMLALAAGVVMAAAALLVAVAGWLGPGWTVAAVGVWVVGTVVLAAGWHVTRNRLAETERDRDKWCASANWAATELVKMRNARRSSIHWHTPDDEEQS